MCYSVTHDVTSSQPVRDTTVRDGYLDAARACILDVGWRRTTLTEVARRAGVSRMTIYRTWSDMPQLLGDLMTREWGSVVAGTLARVGPPRTPPTTPDDPGDDAVTALTRGLVATVAELRENELFVRIVELDPELLLPYLLSRRGRSQQALLELVRDRIAAGQRTARSGPATPTPSRGRCCWPATGSCSPPRRWSTTRCPSPTWTPSWPSWSSGCWRHDDAVRATDRPA